MEQFQKLNPLTFIGTSNLEDVKEWIDQIETIFDLVDCNDTNKVSLATYQFKKNVMNWWRMIKSTLILMSGAKF